MCDRINLFCLLPAVLVTLAYGQSEMTKLTGEAGKNLSVYTGVQADDEVVLSCCPDRRVLLNYHDRKLMSNQSGFHLDTKRGVITISPLYFNHSGEYILEITHHINNSVNNYKYEINVTQADVIKHTAESPHGTTTDQKNGLVVGLSIFAAASTVCVIVVVGLFLYRSGRVGGNCCSSPCKGTCLDNSVL
ncbi:Hypothetical predicted protein [Scomber scombrus]|uniref:Uncharacterized protein n=1 Tax=Scomber scombrus TaxID=13677 RepID=A0AAV1PUX4_SCOSC